jgi:hypothetical protein
MQHDDQQDTDDARTCDVARSASDSIADTEPAPAFSASDFAGPDDRAGYLTNEGHHALAMYDEARGSGFVFVDEGTAT